MIKAWPLIVCCMAAVGVVADDDLTDFSNNLATDLGPLLVLFGDSMTKQYLSESTSFLDYFIFAMAPIGVLTAIVSTIRVCGHSSLRAFIGRSQEGDGVVEAELCTSTSRDVCELFNRGGITRVLGRPNILELVYLPRDGSLHLFRNYLQSQEHQQSQSDPEEEDDLKKTDGSWQKCEERSWLGKTIDRLKQAPQGRPGHSVLPFAPHPNLSLNVGIVKRSPWVFYVISAIGFVLQAGVLILAGTGVWILDWNLSGKGSAPSRNYAPVMFIAGTVLMCSGMWSCAALIGQTTFELRYKRVNHSGLADGERPRLLWLQPGPQVIGDQSFDSFAYFEKKENPLQVWTSSKKDFDEKFEVYTLFSVLATLVGYIMQFIGLRGMKAWVSLAQLGVTVVMSLLRGSLRIQRLGRDDNRLADMPDMVVGHELDWLSFEVAREDSKNPPSWHVTGLFKEAEYFDMQENGRRRSSESCGGLSSGVSVVAESKGKPYATPGYSSSVLQGNQNTMELLRIRRQLAHLTGQAPCSDTKKLGHQKWNDSYVKVRDKARKLSVAICQVADDLWKKRQWKSQIESVPRGQRKQAVKLWVQAVVSSGINLPTICEQPVSITLIPPSDMSQRGWDIDSAEVEAILGLWMWTMISDECVVGKESPQKLSLAEEVGCNRIVSAGPDDDKFDREVDKQGEMDLWLGSRAVALREDILTLDRRNYYGIASLWARKGKNWEALSRDPAVEDGRRPMMRFCGWDSMQRLIGPLASDSADETAEQLQLRVQLISTSGSLLDICSQDLFASLIVSLTEVLTIQETTIIENDGFIQLENPAVATAVRAFVDADLGTDSDALLCLIPAFRSKYPLPSSEDMLNALLRAAETHRKASEWDKAQNLLRWACAKHASCLEDDSASISGQEVAFAKALRATGELYRWSLAHYTSDERKSFGKDGIEWLYRTYHNTHDHVQPVSEILSLYRAIAGKFSSGTRDYDSTRDDSEKTHTYKLLVDALRERERAEALYYLCFVTAENFGSRELQSALPLAVRNDWSEAVGAILEMKASPSCVDEDGRSAISYCAELGHVSYAKDLVRLGAFLDQLNNEQQTPLGIAAEKGHHGLVEILLDTGHVSIEARDSHGETPLFQAAENGHVEIATLLLDKGANIHSIEDGGESSLIRAAKNNHDAIVALLVERGADVNAAGGIDTSLTWAIKNNNEAILEILLKGGADVDPLDDRQRPLLLAVQKGHKDMARQLLESGADAKNLGSHYPLVLSAVENGDEAMVRLLIEHGADVREATNVGKTMRRPLTKASSDGNVAIVKLLLEGGADPEEGHVFIGPSGRDPKPLELAVENEEIATARLLLENGASPNTRTGWGKPILICAASLKNEAVVSLLLEKGADVNATDPLTHIEMNALHTAVRYGREENVRVLLKNGLDVNSKDEAFETSLHYAAERNHEAIGALLLENGADINAKNKRGETPLFIAAEKGQRAIATLLLKSRADINAKNNGGKTPLFIAAEEGHRSTCTLLLENGADINAENGRDETLLFMAVRHDQKELTTLLLENGAEIDIKNGQGETPLFIAIEKGHREIITLLLENGADINATSSEGETPLLKATDPAIMRLMLEKEARVNAMDESAETPLNKAVDQEDE